MSAKRIAQGICLVLLALTMGGCDGTPTPTLTPTDTPIPPTDTPTPAVNTPSPTPVTDTPTLTPLADTPTPPPVTDTPTPPPVTDTPTPPPVTDTPTPTPATNTPTPTPDRTADLLAERYLVQCRHPGEAVEEVDVGDHEPVGTGDEINTDENGLGVLTFSDFLRVEIFVETGLQVKAAPDPDASPIVKLYLALGTTLQELQKRAGERVIVTTETEWAMITSVSTEYLISVDEDGVTSVVVYKGEARVEAQQRAVTLQPGQATYVKPREAPRPPSDVEMTAVDDWVSAVTKPEKVGSIKPVIFPSEDAPTPTTTPTATRTPTHTPIPTPTATATRTPADVRLISDLKITNLSPFVGETVDATFKVRNYGEQTFTARYFGVKGRGPDGSIQDFYMIENFSLAPGGEYTYLHNRTFSGPGEYWFTPHYSPDGAKWLDITWPDGGVSYVYSTVMQDNPPVVEEVYVEPATLYRGDEFEIKLLASDDVGLQSIRWWMKGTEDAYFDNGDQADCGGITWCELEWSLEWIGAAGQFTVYAQARDTVDQLSAAGSTVINILPVATFSLSIGGGPFDDERVQKAVGLAVNWAALRDEIGEVVLVDFLSGDTVVGPTEAAYNPDQAKELLAEAGYPDGFDAMLLFDRDDELAVRLAERVTYYLYAVEIYPKYSWFAAADAGTIFASMIAAGESGLLIERR